MICFPIRIAVVFFALVVSSLTAAVYPWSVPVPALAEGDGDAPLRNIIGGGKPNPAWGLRSIDGIPGLVLMAPAFVEGDTFVFTPLASRTRDPVEVVA